MEKIYFFSDRIFKIRPAVGKLRVFPSIESILGYAQSLQKIGKLASIGHGTPVLDTEENRNNLLTYFPYAKLDDPNPGSDVFFIYDTSIPVINIGCTKEDNTISKFKTFALTEDGQLIYIKNSTSNSLQKGFARSFITAKDNEDMLQSLELETIPGSPQDDKAKGIDTD